MAVPARAEQAAEPAKPPRHHRGGTFQNNYLEFAPRGLLELMRWRWEATRDGLPPPPHSPTPRVPAELAFLRANAAAGAAMQPTVTWIGHATVLAQLGGLNVLTDPIFSERASPVGWLGPQRAQPPGLALAELPRIDAVMISHNHFDHCDLPSLKALAAQAGGPPLFLVPLGLKSLLTDNGIGNVVELDWWQTHTLRGVDIVLTPVQHWSARSLTDRMRTLWGGWAVFAPDFQLFFAGDTGYSKDFADIRARFAARQGERGFDLALLPVGSSEPRWFMTPQHVDPTEAVRVHLDLVAQRSLGIHWGTFALSDEALDEPPRALAAARRALGVADDHFVLTAIGQTLRLPRRGETLATVGE
ncbi:MAG: MBL fold metallo-hydrolase [Leptothrix sp. (in: Bacteria)]|nr:MBL fold metallo-hydrolase [Leptothrix sp. (in: b-proteobacteria)]